MSELLKQINDLFLKAVAELKSVTEMTKWRRNNPKKYQEWRRKYKQTDKSNSRNKARRLLEKSGRAKKCVKCGSNPGSRRLEVHHKDGKMYNNQLSNLEYRCSKCNPRGRGA